MLELNFLVFCLTIIVITAIVFGKTEIAIKALSSLELTTKGFISALSKLMAQVHAPKSETQKKYIDK